MKTTIKYVAFYLVTIYSLSGYSYLPEHVEIPASAKNHAGKIFMAAEVLEKSNFLDTGFHEVEGYKVFDDVVYVSLMPKSVEIIGVTGTGPLCLKIDLDSGLIKQVSESCF